MQMNTEQKSIYTDIVFSSDNSKHCITGNAGTGKTFLTSKIVNYFSDKESVAVVAPTHQALKVLKNKIGLAEDKIHYCTVASLLGQFGFRGSEGSTVFSHPTQSKKSSKFTTIIVDEISQLTKRQ